MNALRFTVLTAFVVAMLRASPAAAEPLTYPNGPYVQPQQNESLSAIRTYDELVATLEHITDSSQGASQMAYLPYVAKGSGRMVPFVKIGNGPKAMTVIAQQHGDEFITSNGMIALIRTLSANSKEAELVRERISLYVVSVFRGMGPRSSRSIPPWSPRRRDASYLPCFASLRPVFCPGLSRARYDSPSMTRS